MAELEKEFLVERIRQLQDANRRWKLLALSSMTVIALLLLLAVALILAKG